MKENSITTLSTIHRLRSTDAVCPRIYGLPKVHKDGVPLRPIVSFVNSATYSLSKYLCNLLSPLLKCSDVDVASSYDFVRFVQTVKWRPGDVMISCDVQSLFTCVPVDLAVSVVEERLNMYQLSDCSLSVDNILMLLRFCLNSSDFCFKGDFYHQKFGCPMGSPVSVTVANLVMQHIEKKILLNKSYDLLFWRRFVDDTWIVIPEQNVDKFVSFINTIENSINFTVEREDENRSLPFLDVLVTRNLRDHCFRVAMYSKPTQSDRYLPFSSHNPVCHKRSVVKCLTKRSAILSSCKSVSDVQTERVCNALLENGYPYNFVKNSIFSCDPVHVNRDQNKGFVCLPYVSKISEPISRILSRHKIKTCFKPCLRLRNSLPAPKDGVDPADAV